MNTASQPLSHVVIPRIEINPDGAVVVVRWGTVLGQVLRPGDRVVPGDRTCRVVVLTPRGRGRPMLALREGRRLLALPGLVPASPDRWQVACGVAAVERDLERGAPGPQVLEVAVRVRTGKVGVDLAAVPPALLGGRLDAGQLEGLCIRAAIAPRQHGLQVALAAAPDAEQARSLLGDTPAGCLRFTLNVHDAAQLQGHVIAGPWPGSATTAQAARQKTPPSHQQVQLPFRVDTRSSA